MSVSPRDDSETKVVGADVRVVAGVLGSLFEHDHQLAIALNAAQRQLLAANERLTVTMPGRCGAVFGSGGADLGVAGRCPPALAAESPVTALGEVANAIRRAMAAYQDAAEQRRQVAADIGEATVRLVDALVAAGFSDVQARRADVQALRGGVYREG